ncbi:MAG TPA: MerR family transcriptional regulator [Streptosporangiaceae bacterium]|nr:MerR family transcriptional regulator [Streptosporangiaceae bacterium]
MSSPYEMSDDTPVYVISVAAQLSGMHPQTLRTYDRMGLVSPGRSAGRGRRYSLRDVLLLREVQRLSQERVNLEGIRRILELENELQRLRGILAEMTTEMAQLRNELESTRAVAARLAGLLRSRGASTSLVPVRGRDAASGRRDAASAAEPASDEPGPALPAAGSNAAVPRPGPAVPGPEPAVPRPEPAAARPDPALSPEAE